MIKHIAFWGALLAAGSAGAADPSQRVADAITVWASANVECRGSTEPDSAYTRDACDRRGRATAELHSLGWCYGKHGELGYQMRWHKCIAASYR